MAKKKKKHQKNRVKPVNAAAAEMANTEKIHNDNKSTRILAGTLALCLLIVAVLVSVLISKISTPAVGTGPSLQYTELPDIRAMTLKDAKKVLDGAGIAFSITQTESSRPNRVLDFDYTGKTENGRILVENGTVVTLYANEVARDKVVYLTFDDGPTLNNTTDILDILDRYEAKATFFVQGQYANNYPDKMRDTAERGHLIGCHSYTHIYGDIYASTEAFLSELAQYEEVMRTVFGDEFDEMPKLLRFPGGTSTIGSKATAISYISEVREAGYAVYDWTALTGDRDGSGNHDKDYYLDNLTESISDAKRNGEDIIILMHDFIYGKENLSYVMDYLASEGYYFDTLDNCSEYTFAEK